MRENNRRNSSGKPRSGSDRPNRSDGKSSDRSERKGPSGGFNRERKSSGGSSFDRKGPKSSYAGKAPRRDSGSGSDESRPKREFKPRSEGSEGRPKRSFNSDRPKRDFKSGPGEFKPKRSFGGGSSEDRPKRNFSSDRPKRDFNRDSDSRPKRDFNSESGDRPKRDFSSDRPKRNFSGDSDSRPKRDFNSESGDRPKRDFNSDRPKRNFNRDSDSRPKRDFNSESGDRPKRDFNSERPKRNFSGDSDSRPKRDFNSESGDRPKRDFNSDRPKRNFGPRTEGSGERKPFRSNDGDKRNSFKKDGPSRDRRDSRSGSESKERSFDTSPEFSEPKLGGTFGGSFESDLEFSHENEETTSPDKKPFEKKTTSARSKSVENDSEEKPKKPRTKAFKRLIENNFTETKQPQYRDLTKEKSNQDELIRLNRFISNAGVCSRRDADELISQGLIKVNGQVITELGYKVKASDEIKYDGRTLKREKNIYILLNKPKDFITTTEDPDERKTVLDLVKNACNERVYPVGRLDRNTTGLIVLTNDGELADKLTHPSNEVQKLYQADLDKPLSVEDLMKIQAGLHLEDGVALVDEIAFVNPEKTSIGLSIHIGKNRIVRRIFEHLGYEVVRLDRVMYAGLSKKDLPRGHWRFLTESELIRIKHMGK